MRTNAMIRNAMDVTDIMENIEEGLIARVVKADGDNIRIRMELDNCSDMVVDLLVIRAIFGDTNEIRKGDEISIVEFNEHSRVATTDGVRDIEFSFDIAGGHEIVLND